MRIMLVEANGATGRRRYALDDGLLRIAHCDAAGVPLAGRAAEIDALREAGRRDPSLGRIYEGHLNGAQLVARFGTAAQRLRLERDLAAGNVFAVWNTQDENGVRIEANNGRFTLAGGKTWASGAGSVTRAIVTAAWPDGSLQMCLIPLDRVTVAIDTAGWVPLGMERSDSFRVDFTGVSLESDDLIGMRGDYDRQPWFGGGALRFLAVHAGIVERLAGEAAAFLVERKRAGDAFQQLRAAHNRIAVATCRLWLDAGTAAWEAFDAEPSERNADAVLETVDMARVVVERSALEVCEAVMRTVGARGLVEPLPFAGLVRDLQMYLRQPAPDAAVLRVAASAFRDATNARNSASAASTGSDG